jgi:hypothetical protein
MGGGNSLRHTRVSNPLNEPETDCSANSYIPPLPIILRNHSQQIQYSTSQIYAQMPNLKNCRSIYSKQQPFFRPIQKLQTARYPLTGCKITNIFINPKTEN